jgi:hypothetical protein
MWLGIAFCGSLWVWSGCSGVQTGDGDLPPCIWQTEVLTDLDTQPNSLGRSPRDLLAPVAHRIQGVLQRPDGTILPMGFSIALDESSARAFYRADDSPPQTTCEPRLEVDGMLHADGGDVFSGTGPVHIIAMRDFMTLQFDSNDFLTSLQPSDNRCATASIVLNLILDASCTWSGDWENSPPLAADTGVACSMDFAQPLGVFSAQGSCS